MRRRQQLTQARGLLAEARASIRRTIADMGVDSADPETLIFCRLIADTAAGLEARCARLRAEATTHTRSTVP